MVTRDDLLNLAERHVEQGRQRIDRQRKVVENLKVARQDVKTAEEVLALFERLQVKFEEDHGRLLQRRTRSAAQHTGGTAS
jgi:hypothetical protein